MQRSDRRVTLRALFAALSLLVGVGAGLTALAAPASAVAPPVNTALPVISGPTTVGGTLTTTDGSWDGPYSFSYIWRRCDLSGTCTDIAGATQQTYVTVSADAGNRIRVVVRADNGAEKATATSATVDFITDPAAPAPKQSGPIVISGLAQVGQTLTTSNGTWAGNGPFQFKYQWYQCDPQDPKQCTPLFFFTASYVVAPTDVGFTLRVSVTVLSPGGLNGEFSEPTAAVTEPVVITTAPPVTTPAPPATAPVAPATAVRPTTARPATATSSDPAADAAVAAVGVSDPPPAETGAPVTAPLIGGLLAVGLGALLLLAGRRTAPRRGH